VFSTLDTSTSALRAERVRLNLIANNLANVNSTRDANGNRAPYLRKLAVFEPTAYGVQVSDIVESNEEPRLVFEPGHPDAMRREDFFKPDGKPLDEFAGMKPEALNRLAAERIGYVEYSNVDPAREMADAVLASRAYEANAVVAGITKGLIGQTLRLIA
jgi:flagellar basal-body rod protein FlgC